MLITVPSAAAVTLKSLISGPDAVSIANTSSAKFNVILQNTGANIVCFEESDIIATTAGSVQLAATSGGAALTTYDLSSISLIANTAPTNIRVSVSAVL